MPRARSITSSIAIPTALLATRLRSSVVRFSLYQCTLETRLHLVTPLMRTALAQTAQAFQPSLAYLSLGRTPKSYWRNLMAKIGWSSSLIMVHFVFIAGAMLAYDHLRSRQQGYAYLERYWCYPWSYKG